MIIAILVMALITAFPLWCLCAGSSYQDEIEEDIWSDEK